MKTEKEVRALLESSLVGWIEAKAFMEFGEIVKPSKAEQTRSLLVVQRGYAHNLADWEAMTNGDSTREYHRRDICRILAYILDETGDAISANFAPDDYIEQHKEQLSPLLVENMEASKQSPENFLVKARYLTDIKPSGR